MPLRMQAAIVLGRLLLLELEHSGDVSYSSKQRNNEAAGGYTGYASLWGAHATL